MAGVSDAEAQSIHDVKEPSVAGLMRSNGVATPSLRINLVTGSDIGQCAI